MQYGDACRWQRTMLVPMSSVSVFRAARGAYVAMHAVFGTVLLVWLYGALFISRDFGKLAAIWATFYGVVLFWLHRFEVVITDNELIFRSLFGEQRIAHGEIALVSLGFHLGSGGGPLRLSVTSRADPNTPVMSINAKVLSREAVRAVLDLGSRVGRSDSGGLEDGVVARARKRHRKGSSGNS